MRTPKSIVHFPHSGIHQPELIFTIILFYVMQSARGFIEIRAENLVCDRDAAAAAEKAG
jgi:hypothetical protein